VVCVIVCVCVCVCIFGQEGRACACVCVGMLEPPPSFIRICIIISSSSGSSCSGSSCSGKSSSSSRQISSFLGRVSKYVCERECEKEKERRA